MIDPKTNKNSNNDDLIEALKTEEDEDVAISHHSNNYEFKTKMRKLLLLIVLLVVVLIIVLSLMSSVTSRKKNYSDVEKVMINAAKKYYNDNKKLLPTTDKSTNEVSVQKLINGGYMKSLDKYSSKTNNCSGKVVVENNDDDYLYVPYLDCGSKYTTTELFREITKSSNIVQEDDGLYVVDDEFVFKGEIVDNYVKLDDSLWRIVKVDSNDDVVLILNGTYRNNHKWDDRYNTEKKLRWGYSDYKKSRMKEYIDDIYSAAKNDDTDKYKKLIFSKNTSQHLVGFDMCYGVVAMNQTVNNNTNECQKVVEDTKIGFLTLSDYLNASLDSTCKMPQDRTCQNYNYLTAIKKSWWLANGTTTSTYQVYVVHDNGILNAINASSYSGVRPVIHLSSKTMYNSGKGTEEEPYTIK